MKIIGGSSEHCHQCQDFTYHPLIQMDGGGVTKMCAKCVERISHGYLHSTPTTASVPSQGAKANSVSL
jgi:hypothetical protein